MSQKSSSNFSRNNTKTPRSLLHGLSLVASLGILSGGVVWAQEVSGPTTPEPVAVDMIPQEKSPIDPAPATPAESPSPPESAAPEPQPEAVPPESHSAEPPPEPAPAPSHSESYVPESHSAEPPPEPAPAPSHSESYVPEHSEEIAPPPAELPPPEPRASEAPNNAYIDSSKDYNIGATDTYEAPTAVKLEERSTGCSATLQVGEGVGTLCAPLPSAPSAPETANTPYEKPYYEGRHPVTAGNDTPETAPGRSPVTAGNDTPETAPGSRPVTAGNDTPETAPRNQDRAESSPPWLAPGVAESLGLGNNAQSEGYAENGGAYSGSENGYIQPASYSGSGEGASVSPLGPIPVGPISVGSTSSSGLAYFNFTARPPRVSGNGNVRILFPLTIPAPITSLFGWRNHPVLGTGRFHSGVDLGADLGTPVVAAYAGQVAIADWLGGYGIAVVLDHQKQALETLYGHLSETFVKSGEWVQQGEVIGRVGSTGMSTGPHLHFELRKLTEQGWVALDPGQQLEFALAQMVKTLETAQKPLTTVPNIPVLLASDLEGGTPKLLPLPTGIEIDIYELEPPPIDISDAIKPKPPKSAQN
jgi:murein DD-endopeptidase MepM/ murein hydrolase activator NlpD